MEGLVHSTKAAERSVRWELKTFPRIQQKGEVFPDEGEIKATLEWVDWSDAGRDKDWRALLERLQKIEQGLLYSPSPVDTLTQEHLRDPFPLWEIQKLAEGLLHLTSPNGTSSNRGDTISPGAPTPRHRPVRTGKEWDQHPSSPRYHPGTGFQLSSLRTMKGLADPIPCRPERT